MVADYCASEQDDWRKYCFWNDIHYTRNLVIENEQFELIVSVYS